MYRMLVRLTTTVAMLSMVNSCVLADKTYLPALPADMVGHRWSNRESFILANAPPADLMWKATTPVKPTMVRLIPSDAEWKDLWEPAPTGKCVWRGKGKARKCVPTASPAVQQAQTNALIRPTARTMGGGTSATVTYDYRPGGIYVVEVAQHAGTHLMLPPQHRLRIPPVLNKEMFVVGEDDTPEEETLNDLVALRARQTPQRAVTVPLIFRSGLILPIRLVTVDGEPMTIVQWRGIPEGPTRAPEPSMADLPPKFDSSRAYTGYVLTVEGKHKLTPPWMPVAVADDGSNTLIQFARALDWTRAPVINGIAQNGKPAITPNRYWTQPQTPDAPAFLFAQGIWPAFTMRDSAGLTIKIERQDPRTAQGDQHAPRY